MTTPEEIGEMLREYAGSRRGERIARPDRDQSIEMMLIPDAHRSVIMGCPELSLLGMTTTEQRA